MLSESRCAGRWSKDSPPFKPEPMRMRGAPSKLCASPAYPMLTSSWGMASFVCALRGVKTKSGSKRLGQSRVGPTCSDLGLPQSRQRTGILCASGVLPTPDGASVPCRDEGETSVLFCAFSPLPAEVCGR